VWAGLAQLSTVSHFIRCAFRYLTVCILGLVLFTLFFPPVFALLWLGTCDHSIPELNPSIHILRSCDLTRGYVSVLLFATILAALRGLPSTVAKFCSGRRLEPAEGGATDAARAHQLAVTEGDVAKFKEFVNGGKTFRKGLYRVLSTLTETPSLETGRALRTTVGSTVSAGSDIEIEEIQMTTNGQQRGRTTTGGWVNMEPTDGNTEPLIQALNRRGDIDMQPTPFLTVWERFPRPVRVSNTLL
jgi:hypothetical protein